MMPVLLVLRDITTLKDFVQAGMKDLPGVTRVVLLLDHDTDQAAIPIGEDVLVCPISVPGRVFGTLYVEVDDPARFAPCEIVVRNLVALMALQLDNMERQAQEQQRANAIEHLNQALERSNQELESFAYIASHDLQQPVRMIGSFADLLRKRYADRLDERGLEYCAFLVDGAKRLRWMIDGLLEYSRVHNDDHVHAWTDLGDVIAEVQRLLSSSLAEVGASVTVGPMPTVYFQDVRLMMIVQNLLLNAVKYRDPERPLVLAIHARMTDDGCEVTFQDNGIGILPVNLDRVFQLFQRGTAPEHTEGRGIGLALVRRSMEHRGGRAWVESTPGEGSSFKLWFPKRIARCDHHGTPTDVD